MDAERLFHNNTQSLDNIKIQINEDGVENETEKNSDL